MLPVECQALSRRVLVIDDHYDTARSFYELLTVMGHRCEFRTDAKVAMDAARELQPELALIDIGLLPDFDGHRLARMLRAEFGGAIVLIAVTAYGRDEDRMRTRRAGFDAHVTKPVDGSLLESILSMNH